MNTLYSRITHTKGYIEEKRVNKYLVFDSTNENKQLLKKYNDAFNRIGGKIKKVCSDECDYQNNYMQIKFTEFIFGI